MKKFQRLLTNRRVWIGVVVVVGGILFASSRGNSVREATQKVSSVITGGGGFDFPGDVKGKENLSKLLQGCPVKDCIPSIDNPEFETIPEANTWLRGEDIVFSLDYKGEARAYPQRILNWHEIVNDDYLISFCPLCGSALAFDRKIGGETLEFGVSGFLHNSDLIMYDRQTNSLWQQITGEAIVGEKFGEKLTQFPLSGMRWSQFKQEFPEGLVLSRETGFSRDYDRYPYGDYEQNTRVNFPVSGGVDNTIHSKTVVYGVEIDGNYKAYPEDKLESKRHISDNVGGVDIAINYNNGNPIFTRKDTGEQIPASRLFWFAWKAFRPDTDLY